MNAGLDLGGKGRQGLVLYDGECILCSGWFRFVVRRDTGRRFLFTAIQSEYGRALAEELGIDPDTSQTNAVLLDGEIYLYSDSALAVLSELPMWRWTRVFRYLPKPLRDRLYLLIARNRYRLLGTRTACRSRGAGIRRPSRQLSTAVLAVSHRRTIGRRARRRP